MPLKHTSKERTPSCSFELVMLGYAVVPSSKVL